MIPDLGSLPAVITAIAAVIGALAALNGAINARRGRKAAQQAAAGIIEVDGKVFQLDRRIDGRLSDLLAANKRAADAAEELAHASGFTMGEQAQRDRSAPAER